MPDGPVFVFPERKPPVRLVFHFLSLFTNKSGLKDLDQPGSGFSSFKLVILAVFLVIMLLLTGSRIPLHTSALTPDLDGFFFNFVIFYKLPRNGKNNEADSRKVSCRI